MVRVKYGAEWHPVWLPESTPERPVAGPMPDWEIELRCCLRAHDAPLPPQGPAPKGCQDFLVHFKRLRQCWFGDPDGHWYYEDNPNEEEMVSAFFQYRRVGVLGHASSAKTTTAVCLAVMLFMIYGKRAKIFLTSTTLGASGDKLWGEVRNAWQRLIEFFGDERWLPGRLMASDNSIRYELNGMIDTTAGIKLIASEVGSDKESAAKIQGTKGDLFAVFADELDTLHQSLMETVNSNLASNDNSYFFGTFNPTTRFSIGGKFVTPKLGWGSVTVDSRCWETETGGMAIHFDALQSINVLAKRVVHRGLLSLTGLAQITQRCGGEDTPGYWRDVRAWFCPIGLAANVADEQEIIQYGALERERNWTERPSYGAGLDTSNTRGGDKNVLTINKTGPAQRTQEDGTAVVIVVSEIVAQIVMKVSGSVGISPEEQITKQLKDLLAEPKWAEPDNCWPLVIGNIAIDTTGGALALPIIRRDIGEPMCVSFKHKPSERIVPGDKRKGTEMFVNKRAEMWWLRPYIRAGQIRGLPAEVVKQLTSVRVKSEYDKDSGRSGNTKLIQIEDKKEFKARFGRSPDEGDSAVLSFEVARVKFGLASAESRKKNARPGYKFETGKEMPTPQFPAGREVQFEVPILDDRSRFEQERWLRPEEKKQFYRQYGPPGGGELMSPDVIIYGGGTTEW